MTLSRRAMLYNGAALAGAALAGWTGKLLAAVPRTRSVAFVNLHTGERFDGDYFQDGEYLQAALEKIENVLRDFRNDERHAIDPTLMDYLVDVATKVGSKPDFSVISGYRSPETNEKLRAMSSGVAQHSLHMQGRAIDVRINGVDCAAVAASALTLKRGGVGYYRASDFVHLDTGAFRTWRG